MSRVGKPDALTRLQAANPVAVDPDRGRSEVARAALQRILVDRAASAGARIAESAPRRRWWRERNGLVIVLVAMLIGGGAAFAATDPLGWWSSGAGEAKYGINPDLRVSTPTIQQITCRSQSTGRFRCVAGHSGQHYSLIDAIRQPAAFTRARLNTAIARELAAGKLNSSTAARLRADLAAVPDGFFRTFEIAMRYGTYGGVGDTGNGRVLAPPPGVPAWLICENAGAGLSCRDLNGDAAVPIGAGVYAADPSAGWRPARPSKPNFALPPGIAFTTAELRLLIDLSPLVQTTTTASPSPARSTASAQSHSDTTTAP